MTDARPQKAIRLPILIGAILVLACLGFFASRRRTPTTLVLGPMVQFPEPTTLVINWQVDPPAVGTGVTLRPAAHDASAHHVGAADVAIGRQAQITGLKPGAAYEYEIHRAGWFGTRHRLAGPFPVRIPPPRDTPFRFVVFGDSGSGSNSQLALGKLIASTQPDVAIHVGDLIYPAGALADYRYKFFEPYAELLRGAAFLPVLGNHDVASDNGAPLLDVFQLPRNGPEGIEPERCFWFDYGAARFVGIDSNNPDVQKRGVIDTVTLESVVAPWARRVLDDCDATWKFAYFHHPYYTGSTHPAEGGAYLKRALAPIFESTGVDVVFCGHNHLYERTAPIRDGRIVEDGAGVVYVTTGAGGARRYPAVLPSPEYIRVYNEERYSFTQVDLSPDRLVLKQIDERGEVIDTYTLAADARRTDRTASAND